MLAVGEQLLAQGADVVIATLASYESACRKSGLEFCSIGGADDYVSGLRLTRDMLEQDSFERFVDGVVFDQLDQMYAQISAAACGADALLAPTHVGAAHLVAEKMDIPYIACAMSLLHIRPPAKLGSAEYLRYSLSAARWNATLRRFRLERSLRRRAMPFSSFVFDAPVILGLFPSLLLPDDLRLPHLQMVGYASHAQTERMIQDDAMRSFCDERTVAFSFGSVADACDPNHFFEVSVAACERLNLKCMYLTRHVTERMMTCKADFVSVRSDIAPGAVFPLSALVVHHAGTGAIAAACAHLKPMVTVPFFLDQPLHAVRMQSLIGAPKIRARDYSYDGAVQAIGYAFANRAAMTDRLRTLTAGMSDGAQGAATRVLALLRDLPRNTSI